MTGNEQIVPTLARNSSCKSTSKIIPASFCRSTSSSLGAAKGFHSGTLVRRPGAALHHRSGVTTFLRSLVSIFTLPSFLPSFRWLHIPTHLSVTPTLGRKVTGTLFGHRRGHVSFAVQDGPRSEPVLLIEFAVSTSTLVKEMSSGLVRIALECEKVSRGGGKAVRGAGVDDVLQREEVRVRGVEGVDGVGPARAEDGAERVHRRRRDTGGGRRPEKQRGGGGAAVHAGPVREGGGEP